MKLFLIKLKKLDNSHQMGSHLRNMGEADFY